MKNVFTVTLLGIVLLRLYDVLGANLPSDLGNFGTFLADQTKLNKDQWNELMVISAPHELKRGVGIYMKFKDQYVRGVISEANADGTIKVFYQDTNLGENLAFLKLATSSLMAQVQAGDISEVKKLLNAGFNLNAKDPLGATVLIQAARNGNASMVTTILDFIKEKDEAYQEQVLNATDNEGDTALIKSVTYGKKESVKAILSFIKEKDLAFKKAVLNKKGRLGNTALMSAAWSRMGRLEKVSGDVSEFLTFLKDEDENLKKEILSSKNDNGDTVLHWCCNKNNEKSIKAILTFLEKMDDEFQEQFFNEQNKNGTTALMMVDLTLPTFNEMLKFLRNKKDSFIQKVFNTADKNGDTVLINFMRQDQDAEKLFQFLRSQNREIQLSSISAKNKDGNTALIEACSPSSFSPFSDDTYILGNIQDIFDLIESSDTENSVINMKNNKGETALIKAVDRQLADLDTPAGFLVARKILNYIEKKSYEKDFINEQNLEGNTALMIAASHGYLNLVKLILTYIQEKDLKTPGYAQEALNIKNKNNETVFTVSTSTLGKNSLEKRETIVQALQKILNEGIASGLKILDYSGK